MQKEYHGSNEIKKKERRNLNIMNIVQNNMEEEI